MGVGIISTGKRLAENIITNEDIAKIVTTDNDWIVERTGIRERRIATTEKSLDLALGAAKEALQGIDYDSIDLVIVTTVTPDMLVPSMGSMLKMELGLANAVVFDLNSACSGFIYGLWTAEALINASQTRAGRKINRALVVGSERLSRMLNWEDRGTCILLGDGAGCTVLEYREGETGIISSCVKNYDDVDQALRCGLEYRQTPFSQDIQEPTLFTMHGTKVLRFAVGAVDEMVRTTLEYAGMAADDVDFFVPHQANLRIIKAAAQKLKQPLEKFQINIDKTGNVSAASIPMALHDAMMEGKIKKGDKIILVGFGGGLSAGAMLIEMW